MNGKMKGGAGATLIAVFLAATFAGGVSLAGLTSTFTNAFEGISFENDVEFLEDFVATNVKAACNSPNRQVAFPAESNMSKQLSTIERIRVREKETLFGAGDKFMTLQVDKGGSKTDINLDTNGWLGSWRCNSAGADGLRINTTSSGYSNPLNKGEWLDVSGNKIQHFRVLEISHDTNKVRIQVRQTDG